MSVDVDCRFRIGIPKVLEKRQIHDPLIQAINANACCSPRITAAVRDETKPLEQRALYGPKEQLEVDETQQISTFPCWIHDTYMK